MIELAKQIYANAITGKYSTFTKDEAQRLVRFSVEAAKVFYEVVNGRRNDKS